MYAGLGKGKMKVRVLWQGGLICCLAVVLGLLFNQLRPDGIPLVADWSMETQAANALGENLAIPLEEAEVLFYAGEAVFIDARHSDDYALGHIQGALNLTPEEMEAVHWRVMAGIPHDAALITYCDGESCSLSKEVALLLREKGYSNVRMLLNGWSLWRQADLPVDADM
jgi:rhodanese-related sulfurtransferase